MNEYVIRYRIKTSTRERIAVVRIPLLGDGLAIDLCNELQAEGNYVEELINNTTRETIYDYKQARFSHILKLG